jgi:hypothetical protein
MPYVAKLWPVSRMWLAEEMIFPFSTSMLNIKSMIRGKLVREHLCHEIPASLSVAPTLLNIVTCGSDFRLVWPSLLCTLSMNVSGD